MQLYHDLCAFARNETRGWRISEIAWLVFCLASILSLSIYWHDSALGIIAGVTGVLYTVLAGKGKISCYLFGLVNAPIYAWLSWQQKYYGDMALNIYYFVMMVPGMICWTKNQEADRGNGIVKTRLSASSRVVLIVILASASAILWWILHSLGGNRPLCDSLTNMLSIAAMILTVKRCIEQWWMWIAVDAIEVFMWWKVGSEASGGISILLMWLLFLLNGFFLYAIWIRDMRNGAKRTVS